MVGTGVLSPIPSKTHSHPFLHGPKTFSAFKTTSSIIAGLPSSSSLARNDLKLWTSKWCGDRLPLAKHLTDHSVAPSFCGLFLITCHHRMKKICTNPYMFSLGFMPSIIAKISRVELITNTQPSPLRAFNKGR